MLIPGFESGLVQNIDDSLIPDNACSSLVNAYVWRKRLLKKGGYYLFGRLGRRQDTISIAASTLSYFPVEPGSLSYVQGGNTYVDTPTGAGNGTIAGGTINYTTGAYTGLPVAPAGVMSYNVVVDAFSPAMGIFERDIESINEEECIAFDRKMAYAYGGTDFTHLKTYLGGVNAVEWTGSNSDFFYACNYYGALWATNDVPGLHGYTITAITQAASAVITIGAHSFANNDVVHISGVVGMVEINGLSGTVTATAATTITVNINSAVFTAYTSGGFCQALNHSVASSGDGIRWYAGSGWVNFAPPLSSASTTQYLQGCKFILPFKDRLLCLNTWEGSTYAGRQNYYNRVRFSSVLSTPYYANVFPTGYSYSPEVWYEQPGSGGYIEAPTEERIIGVEYIKDYLLVLFERSSYILRDTGNRNLPFVFQKINSEFGTESSHSVISFDSNVLSVGNRGIYGVSSSGAERIDEKVPDIAFEMQNSVDGVKRVYGVRDFFSQVVFWAYRSIDTFTQGTFPNRVLLYNYENGTWAIFKNSFTCFGSHITETDWIWDNVGIIWDECDVIWDDARAQSNNPTTLAGNQQGYIFALDLVGENAINGNSISLSIESMTTGVSSSVFTSVNHNLEPEDIVQLHDLTGTAEITALNSGIYRVGTASYTADTFTLQTQTYGNVGVAGTYYGAGKVTPIDNFEVVTKSFNPYVASDRYVRFNRADFLLSTDDETTAVVQTYVDKVPPASNNPTNSEEIIVEGDSKVKKWYWTYPQSYGSFVQLRILFPDSFMFNLSDDDTALARTGFDISMCRLWFSRG
jgi:hypothetical protein